VSAHVLVLFPPLEQASDQIPSRPLLTLNVIEVLTAKLAEPVLPTSTLMRSWTAHATCSHHIEQNSFPLRNNQSRALPLISRQSP
jgi:hypothetical protein